MSKYLYILLIACLGLSMPVTAANDVEAANDAYHMADYHKAVRLYHQSLKKGASTEIYYNLGNAYYRIDNVPKALLYYEKASKMAPMNDDILHNIDIVQAKTIDKLPVESEIFFVQWYRYIQSFMTIDGWAHISIISLVLALVLFLAYLFLNNVFIRRSAFYSSVVLLALFILGNLFAWQRKSLLDSHDAAIVMSNAVSVKTSPTLKATDACVIHEGTKVRITDNDMKDWLGIRLSDGREGWIPSRAVEEI